METPDSPAPASSFDKTFRKSLIALVIPIALQNLISAAVNAADVLMLGTIGQAAIAGVSLANQVTFVIILSYAGLSVGVGILSAQYWGKKDLKAIQRVLSIGCSFSFTLSLLFFLVSLFFPTSLVRLFTDDPELIFFGSKYQQTMSFSYLAMGLSQMYFGMARSMEKARFTAMVTSACLLLNITLNALCIYVLFPGMPEKAIAGVAAGTVIVRFTELGCCVIHSLRVGPIRFRLPVWDTIQKLLLKDYLRYMSPALGAYVVWSTALATMMSIIGHVSSDMVAANAYVAQTRNLAVILCFGIGSAGSILVGKYLGSGDLESAKKAGIRLYIYALIFGIIAGGIVLLIKPLVLNITSLNETASHYLDIMLNICAAYCIGKSLNGTIIGGLFPAGGDAKFDFFGNIIVLWCMIIPTAYVCAFVFHIDPLMIYVIISLDETIKVPAAIIRFRQYKWLKNLTRDINHV